MDDLRDAHWLGDRLMRQRKFAEAEPLIVSGYEGMKAREARISMEYKYRLTEAGEGAFRLYEDWGKPEKADEWRARVAKPSTAPRKQP